MLEKSSVVAYYWILVTMVVTIVTTQERINLVQTLFTPLCLTQMVLSVLELQ